MTVSPLLVMSEGSGPPKIINLNKIADMTVTCPTVSVTTGPPPSEAGAGGFVILLGLGLLTVVMTSKKKQ